MSTKYAVAGWVWPAILASTMAVEMANGMDAQPTESAVGEAYDQSCLAPYREELAGWQATQLVDRAAYRQMLLAAQAAAADSCSAFVQQVESHGQPGAQESPYLREAKALMEGTPDGECIKARVVSEVVRAAEPLYRLALCHMPGGERTALLLEARAADPGHLGSLFFLTDADLNPQTRAEYGELLYQRGEDILDKTKAAKAIVKAAVDSGDSAAAHAIHDRFKRYLLNEPLLERCRPDLHRLGLEEVCVEAIESMAADALATDDGDIIRLDDERIRRLEARKRRYQRRMARQVKGSNRYKVVKARSAKASQAIRHIRDNWQHHASKQIAAKGSTVVVEKLNSKGMTASAKGTVEQPGKNVAAKAGLNREILNTGWSACKHKIAYKSYRVIEVPARNTSRTCNECGYVDANNRKTQALFVCVLCGHRANADTNAAKNIRDRGLVSLMIESASGTGASGRGGGDMSRPVKRRYIANLAA